MSLCLRVVLCGVCGVCVVLCCVVCVWCGVVCDAAWHPEKTSVCIFKTSPCVPAPRAHVLPHAGVVQVHTGTFWIYTRRFLGRTHGGEGEKGGRREGGVTVSSANHETAHVELSRALETFTERNPWFLPIQGLRTGREQHVLESSNHSLYLTKPLSSIFILRDTAEGISTHNTHMRTNTHSPTHPTPLPSPPSPPPLPLPPSRTRKRTCTCTCMCVYAYVFVYVHVFVFVLVQV